MISKKVLMFSVLSLFIGSALIEAGLNFGMPRAVKRRVKELDKKVIEKRAIDTAVGDTTAPTVSSTNPIDEASGTDINRKITAIFSEVMDPVTITTTTFTLMKGTASVAGTVTYVDKTALFNPTVNLMDNSTYTAKVIGGISGAADLAGNVMAVNKVWTFVTSASSDTVAPTVLNTYPADAAIDVVLNTNISATFSEAIDPATITGAFTLKKTVSGTPVAGTANSVGTTASFSPTSNLSAGTTYTATISAGVVADLAGNLLSGATTWSFITGAAVAVGPAPVNLGTAGNFVILTKTGLTTTGTTEITGDIGVSPIDSTAITGFSLIGVVATDTFLTSALVTGKIYAADLVSPTPSNMTTAISDLHIAYMDAAGRSLPDFAELGAGDISGMTLAPGLYKWGTGVLITNVGVTLAGGANDVWIFQIADNLTVNNAAIVTLTGGAQAKNIFWQVGGGVGVSLGTTSQFKGIILATKAITLDTGATLTGRALAETNVTLDANTITAP